MLAAGRYTPLLQRPRPAVHVLAPLFSGSSRSARSKPPCVAALGQPGPNAKTGWDWDKFLSVGGNAVTVFSAVGGIGYYVQSEVRTQIEASTKELSAKIDSMLVQTTQAITANSADSRAAIDASIAATNAASNAIFVMAFMAIFVMVSLAIVFAFTKTQDGK